MTAVKIATSLPAEQFDALEQMRARLGLKRSAAVQEALVLWLATKEAEGACAQYVRGYMSHPEDAAEGAALVEAWADGMENEIW